LHKNHSGTWAVALLKNPKNKQKTSRIKGKAKSHIWGVETDCYKFCMSGAMHDIITHANFGEDG